MTASIEISFSADVPEKQSCCRTFYVIPCSEDADRGLRRDKLGIVLAREDCVRG